MKSFVFILIFHLTNLCIAQSEQRANVKKLNRWQIDSISVCWENPEVANKLQRNWVEDAIIGSWQKESKLVFTGWGTCQAKDMGIRINIDDVNPNTKGLGYQLNGIKDGMTLNFEFKKWKPIENAPDALIAKNYEMYVRSIAIHEFGHAIGFAHEQNRPDCQNGDCNESMIQGANGDWTVASCDIQSIMNYCNPDYNNNGKLSNGDILGVFALYGVPNSFYKNSATNKSSLMLITNALTSLNEANYFDICLYLSGASGELSDIQKVVYNFPPPINKVTLNQDHLENMFSVDFPTDKEFVLNADVTFKSGKKIKLIKNIEFKNANPPSHQRTPLVTNLSNNRVSDLDDANGVFSYGTKITSKGKVSVLENSFKIISKIKDLGENKKVFKVSIDPKSADFEKIFMVTYEIYDDFGEFTENTDRKNLNYEVNWTAETCDNPQITIYYKSGEKIGRKVINYKICQ